MPSIEAINVEFHGAGGDAGPSFTAVCPRCGSSITVADGARWDRKCECGLQWSLSVKVTAPDDGSTASDGRHNAAALREFFQVVSGQHEAIQDRLKSAATKMREGMETFNSPADLARRLSELACLAVSEGEAARIVAAEMRDYSDFLSDDRE